MTNLLTNADKNRIFRAVQTNNLREFERLINGNPDRHVSEVLHVKTGDNVLHVAARLGHAEILKFILDKYAPNCVNIQNNDDKTPLHEAAQFAQIATLKLLLEYGANVNAIKRSDWTPLMLACTRIKDEDRNLELVKTLISSGALLDYRNKDGWSALHLVCRENAPRILQYLLDNGADPELVTKNGRSALHVACLHANANANTDIAATLFLLNNANVNINLKDYSGNTPIHEATAGGSLKLIDQLVAHGADVSARNSADFTILHLAASVDLEGATVKHLVTKYAQELPVNVRNKFGFTPLHCAAKNKNARAFACLRSVGGDVLIKDNFCRTPLDYLNSKS